LGTLTPEIAAIIFATKGICNAIKLRKLKGLSAEVKVLDYKTSSGVTLKPNPEKTTAVLGNYQNDMRFIIDELKVPKSTDYSGNKGGFNVLNVPDELNRTPEQFFIEYNKPFLDEAIARGDDIVLATKPTNDVLYKRGGSVQTIFGREYEYLIENGYVFDDATNMMIKP